MSLYFLIMTSLFNYHNRFTEALVKANDHVFFPGEDGRYNLLYTFWVQLMECYTFVFV